MTLSCIFKLGQQAKILLSNMDAYGGARDKSESKYYRWTGYGSPFDTCSASIFLRNE